MGRRGRGRGNCQEIDTGKRVTHEIVKRILVNVTHVVTITPCFRLTFRRVEFGQRDIYRISDVSLCMCV